MTSSALVHEIKVSDIPMFEARIWRDDLLSRMKSGMRAVSLFGERQDRNVVITSILQAPDHTLHVSRGITAFDQGYHDITSSIPALHCFEREMHEQTGIKIAGHPWLKPIRYQDNRKGAMDDYPFYKVDGKEVHEVAVGPIHAGIIEPGSFRFMCAGERILHLEIQLGYQHRGVEKLLLAGNPLQLTPLVETIAGDSSVAHAWAYCAAVERLAGSELELESDFARAAALELERVAMHLSGLAGLAGDIGFLQGATSYGRLRTLAINSTMQLCGNRLGRGALRPGGIGLKVTSDILKTVRGNIQLLQKDLAIINERFLSSQTVQHRLVGTGIVTKAIASELGLVGPAARASGVSHDTREHSKDGAYADLPIPASVLTGGDCWDRARIRIKEMDASLSWLTTVFDRQPGWQGRRKPAGYLQPDRLVVTVVEGWRGEVVHCLETNGAGGIAHYKVQDPSLRNWLGLAIAVRGNEISDFPICNKSFDLSYCGNDL